MAISVSDFINGFELCQRIQSGHRWHRFVCVGSSQANPFACIASGIAALWGPAHGGANEAVLQMLQKIGTKENIPSALARAKDKSESLQANSSMPNPQLTQSYIGDQAGTLLVVDVWYLACSCVPPMWL